MKIAIMQPYFFPYIGYFQIIQAVDKFIFYDDVNFIKNGWINRNRIIINNDAHYITIQLKGASPHLLIHEIKFTDNRKKIKKSIQMSYKKAPFYNQCWPVIEEILSLTTENICNLAIFSVKKISQYLGIKVLFEVSSDIYGEIQGLTKEARLIKICKMNNAKTYINSVGGKELYKKSDFEQNGISLLFLKPKFTEYIQFSDIFIPGLSIIDVMMFNSVKKIRKMLDDYELE